MEPKFNSDLINKVKDYVEAHFDSNILPSLMGIISSPSSFLTNLDP